MNLMKKMVNKVYTANWSMEDEKPSSEEDKILFHDRR